MYKSKLTPKENFMRLANFEMPDYVPIYMMGFDCYNNETAVKAASPMMFMPKQISEDLSEDMFGVRQKSNKAGANGSLPEPDNFILEDVKNWDKVIKLPEMPDVNWEMMAKEAIEKIDREQSAVMSSGLGFFSPFLTFISFMGFTEGLCALYEETEAVKELLNYLCDFFVPIVEKTVEYYKPDLVSMGDDFASHNSPFFSKEIYNEIFKPVYHRLAKPAMDRGIPIIFHLCGNGEDYVQELYDFGVRFWEPAQGKCNDLLAVKEKYKGKMNIIGGFDWTPPPTWPHVEEEYVRQMLRDCYDTYAPGGGYAYIGHILEMGFEDEVAAKCNQWLNEESYYYGRDYYLK